jgi:predicted nuclease of restriction endonuclease-like (RecB) superfamily
MNKIIKEDNDKSYKKLLETLKQEITKARIRAHLAVNKELIVLYWNIGNNILNRQQEEGWGTKVIENISKDLQKEFPEMKGLSYQNISYMRQFATEYPEKEFLQQPVGEIPWGHNIVIFSKVKSFEERKWYIQKTIENGWSRNVLNIQIKSNLYSREGKGLTNFKNTLPAPYSDLAQELVKDPYNLQFLDIQDKVSERHLENKLIDNIKSFLLELGKSFAFVGNQYHLNLEGEDYYIDLLFYHIKLKCYVVIELKTGKFKPEYAGKLNFYLNLVDHQLKDQNDNKTIGIILCEEKNNLTVEYSIQNISSPMGVSHYTLTETLPKSLKEYLPTPQDLSKLTKSEK